MPQLDMPPVTDDHRHRAFEILAMRGVTFEMAMADEFRRRVIECCAARLRFLDFQQTNERTVEPVRRVQLGADGHPIGWCTQMVPSNFTPITQPPLI